MRTIVYSIACLLCFSILSVHAEDKITLKLNLKQNDAYRVTIPMKMPTDISIELDAAKMKKLFSDALGMQDSAAAVEDTKDTAVSSKTEKVSMNMNMEISMIFKVVNVGKGDYKLEAYYEYLESGIDTKDESVFYSTRKKDNKLNKEQEDEFKTVKSAIGKKFFIIISDKGVLKEIIGYEKVISGFKKEAGNPFGKKESVMIKQLNKADMSNTIRGIFDVLPERPVKRGDTWSKEYLVEDEAMPYTIRTKYTLKAINATDYDILSESIFFSDAMKQQMAKVSGQGKGDIKLFNADNFQQIQPYSMDMFIDMDFLGMLMKTDSKVTGTYKVEKIQ